MSVVETTEAPTTAGAPGEPEAIAGRTPRQLFWERFKEDKAALVGLALILVLVLLAALAGVISKYVVHHGPNELFEHQMTDLFGLPKGPNSSFWFGADGNGRDVFIRTL